MEIETLRELQKTLKTVEVSNVDCMKDFSEGYNAGIRHVKRQLELMIDARIEVARIVGEPVVSKMVQATPTPKPELKPKAETQVKPTPKATSAEELEPGELPPGWRFLEVGEFLQNGDVLNSTGFGVDTGGRDDMRCTAKRTWRRKK